MNACTYTEARREPAPLLGQAPEEGAARIERRNEQSFALRPEPKKPSSFDGVTGVKADLAGADVVEMVRESRKQ